MKPTPDSAYGAPLKGAIPAARQSRFRGIPGIWLRRFHASRGGALTWPADVLPDTTTNAT